MINDAKDYFTAESTTYSSIIDAIGRYMYLIQKYSTLNSSKFIDDSNGVLLLPSNQVIANDIETYLDMRNLLIALITFVFVGLFFLTKKYIAKFNQ